VIGHHPGDLAGLRVHDARRDCERNETQDEAEHTARPYLEHLDLPVRIDVTCDSTPEAALARGGHAPLPRGQW
jgi:hypothetical protein